MIDLDDIYTLRRASAYQFPSDASALLPKVYGDFIAPSVLPADDEDGGFLPAVQIDRLNWVYLLNDGPMPATPAPKIYVGDYPRPQDASVYTFFPSVDYEGSGHLIAAIKFLVNPGSADRVSWRGMGTRNPDNPSVPLTDPFACLQHAFASQGWTLDDFNLPVAYDTFRTLAALGVSLQWCFWQERTFREWLTEIMRCFHISFWEDDGGKLSLKLDRAMLGFPVGVLTTIDAQTDLDGTEDDVTYHVSSDNIVNLLTVKRRLKWTDQTYTDEPIIEYRKGMNLHQARLPAEIDLPAVYSEAHTSLWVNAFFERYGLKPALVRFTTRGIGYAAALPGTELGLIAPWLGWTEPRLLLVLNQDPDPQGQRISFECFDCGRSVADTVTLPSVAVTPVRRRPRVPDRVVDLTPPGAATNVTASGSFRRIVVRWTAPRDFDYRYTEIWRSQANNRATATHIRTGGHGAPGQTCEETFDVIEGETWFIWLMTVDQQGNGQDGGAPPSGGNWAPASPTAGISATSALIDTAAVAPEAVTVVYPTGITFPGLKQGLSIVAATHVPAQPPNGSFIVWATALVEINSQCTLVAFIQQGSTTGIALGQTHTFNSFAGNATFGIIVPGAHFNPVFGVDYLLTLRSLNPQGLDFQFIVQNASLQVQHTKR